MPGGKDADQKVIATHRRARFDYEILERMEAGLVLLGPEVKSLRAGKASLADAYALFRRGEAFLENLHISPYPQAGRENPDPSAGRQACFSRKEIARLRRPRGRARLHAGAAALYFRGPRKVDSRWRP